MIRSCTAAALALSAPWLACAQSSMAVFGTVDLYLAHARSGPASYTRLDDGGHTASRLGFRGSEDLGAGLKAHFLLEAGFGPDTGSGTLPGPTIAFTRQSFVGLSGPWGQVDAGRMYTPMFYAVFRADPLSVNAVFSPLNLLAATDAQAGAAPFAARASNMLRYRTPSGSRFIADFAWAFGEATRIDPASAGGHGGSSGDLYGGTIGWQSKPWYVAYAFQRVKAGTAAAPVFDPASTTFQALSAAYDWGPLRLTGNLTRTHSSRRGVAPSRIASLGAQYPLTPEVSLIFEAARREVSGSERGQLAWTLGGDWTLSKRTALYGRLLRLNNRHGASASLAGVPVAPNSGDDVRVIAAGIRHNF